MDFDRVYKQLFIDGADPRVETWFMMKDPLNILIILGLYLAAIYRVIPKHMENRKPYNLKLVLQAYNVFQVISCMLIIYNVVKHGWLGGKLMGCLPVDFSNNESAVTLLKWTYLVMWLKVSELAETCFFGLRKKDSQITFLHVYHHTLTLFFAWVLCKYAGGGMSVFLIIINSSVHVVMYSYYALSTLGPELQKRLSWIKPKITSMQLVQFIIILIYTSQILRKDCKMPKVLLLCSTPHMVILFGFFFQFYLKSYKAHPKKGKENKFTANGGEMKYNQ